MSIDQNTQSAGVPTRITYRMGLLIFFGLAYWLSTKLGLLFISQAGGIAVVWPASGLLLAALLLSSRRVWPSILLLAFLINVTLNLTADYPLAVALGFAVAECVEGTFAAWLLFRFFHAPINISRLPDMVGVVGIAAILGNGLTAILGALVIRLSFGAPFWDSWFTWWMSAGIGTLLLTPPILAWTTIDKAMFKRASPLHIVEVICLFAALIGATYLIFTTAPEVGSFVVPLPYATFPFLIWSALRFGSKGATSASLVLSVIAIWNTFLGRGPFASITPTTSEEILAAQAFLGASALTALVIAAVITERKQAERALRESEEKFRSIVESSLAGIFMIDDSYHFVYTNDELCRILGYPRNELTGLDFREPLSDESRAMVADRYIRQQRGEMIPARYEVKVVRRNGEARDVEMIVTVVKDVTGKSYSMGQLVDITERKQLEYEAEERRLFLESVLAAAPDAIVTSDTRHVISEWNPGAKKLFGYSSEEAIGRRIDELITGADPQVLDEAISWTQQIQSWRGITPTETVRYRKDGSSVNVIVSVAPILIENEWVGVVAIYSDITERKQAEILQGAIYRIAQAADQAKSLDTLYPAIHTIIHEIMPANNFYIALYDEKNDLLSFPYSVDERDPQFPPTKPGKGLTEYVLRASKSVLCDEELYERLIQRGEIELVGEHSPIWLGVPLITEGKAIGVMVVQDYKNTQAYGEREQRILEFVSSQAAMAIHRKQADELLRENEARYRNIFEGVKDAIFVETPSGKILDVNQRACEMFGYSRAQFLTKTVADLVPSEKNIVLVNLKDSPPLPKHPVETINVRGNGEQFPIEISISLQKQKGESVLFVVGRDITERKQGEEKVRKHALRAEALAHTATQINRQLDLGTMLKSACEETARALNVQASVIFLTDPVSQTVNGIAGYGLPYEFRADVPPVPLSVFIEGLAKYPDAPIILQDHQAFPDISIVGLLARFDIRTIVVTAIKWQSQVIGALIVGSIGKTQQFDMDELSLLQALADEAAQAIMNARFLEDARRRLERLEALRTIDNAITASLDLRHTLSVFLEQLRNQLHVDAADILLFNPHSLALEYASSIGMRTDALKYTHLHPNGDPAGQVILNRQRVQIPDMRKETSFSRMQELVLEGFVSYYGVPLVAKGKVHGVLEIFHRTLEVYDNEWLDFLDALAGQAAISIDNAALFNELQRSNLELILAYDATIDGWSRAMDLRDKETEGHTQRVTQLTYRLAQAMGLEDEELTHIRRGAMLHDIGKMGVPDDVLLKPGRLNKEEEIAMQKHPQYAYEMLSSIKYLKPSLSIPYCHHEKWDGTGYPRGLAGDQIPLAARLFAVVDVWDALTSDRPYRASWSKGKAMVYIRNQSGKYFDPEIVKVFVEMIAMDQSL